MIGGGRTCAWCGRPVELPVASSWARAYTMRFVEEFGRAEVPPAPVALCVVWDTPDGRPGDDERMRDGCALVWETEQAVARRRT